MRACSVRVLTCSAAGGDSPATGNPGPRIRRRGPRLVGDENRRVNHHKLKELQKGYAWPEVTSCP